MPAIWHSRSILVNSYSSGSLHIHVPSLLFLFFFFFIHVCRLVIVDVCSQFIAFIFIWNYRARTFFLHVCPHINSIQYNECVCATERSLVRSLACVCICVLGLNQEHFFFLSVHVLCLPIDACLIHKIAEQKRKTDREERANASSMYAHTLARIVCTIYKSACNFYLEIIWILLRFCFSFNLPVLSPMWTNSWLCRNSFSFCHCWRKPKIHFKFKTIGIFELSLSPFFSLWFLCFFHSFFLGVFFFVSFRIHLFSLSLSLDHTTPTIVRRI